MNHVERAPETHQENNHKISRREFLKYAISGALGSVAIPDILRELALARERLPEKSNWFYTLEEIERIYAAEYTGTRIENYFRRINKRIIGKFRNQNIEVPEQFVAETLRHLKEILKIGAAKFLHRLDLGHAHFVVSEQSWEKIYRKLKIEEMIARAVKDRNLLALYHASEHLTSQNPKTGEINPQTEAQLKKRNILGYYNGKPITILPPLPKHAGAGPPEGYTTFSGFDIKANRRGEFAIKLPDGKEIIYVDFSFESNEY